MDNPVWENVAVHLNTGVGVPAAPLLEIAQPGTNNARDTEHTIEQHVAPQTDERHTNTRSAVFMVSRQNAVTEVCSTSLQQRGIRTQKPARILQTIVCVRNRNAGHL